MAMPLYTTCPHIAKQLQDVDAALAQVHARCRAYFDGTRPPLTDYVVVSWNEVGPSVSFLPTLRADIAQAAHDSIAAAWSGQTASRPNWHSRGRQALKALLGR